MTSSQERGSAQDRAYDWLKNHIATVPRHEGVFLSENQVAVEARASRTPVREALLRLEAEGYLSIVPKKGAYVPPVSDAEVEAVMQARALVEDWCVRRVAEVADGLSEELNGLIAEQERLAGDPVAFIECDRQFHRTIVAAAGNPVLLDFYESLRDRQIRMGVRAVTSTEERTRQVLQEHQAIVDVLSDPVRSVQAVTDHLDNTLAILRRPSGGYPWASSTTAGGLS